MQAAQNCDRAVAKMQVRTELKQTYPYSRRLEGFMTVWFASFTHKITQITKNTSLVNMMNPSRTACQQTHTNTHTLKVVVP